MPPFPIRATSIVEGTPPPSCSIEGLLRWRIDARADLQSARTAAVAAPGAGAASGPVVSGPVAAGPVDVSRLPGTARILLIPEATRVSARIRNRYYDRLPDIAVIGPSSRPVALRIDGVAPVEIPLSALDWSCLTRVAAALIADRIVPVQELGITCLDRLVETNPDDIAAAAIARLADATGAHGMPPGDDANALLILRLMTLIDAGLISDAATAADALATTPHNLRRIALRWFGFPPKTLLMRRRFIAALERFQDTGMDIAAIADFGYFDASHFLRDANRFLGTTPRRYLRRIAGSADGRTTLPAAR